MPRVSLYPPSPDDVPDDLTRPTRDYQSQMAMVLFSLGLFFVLYFGVMACCALVLGLFAYTLLSGRPSVPLVITGVVLGLPCLLLFLYMLKNLFHWEKDEKTDDVEIFEHEHPKLFDFIHRVCDETGAPYPQRVFVNAEVNAAAISVGNAFWHLFIPTAKNLRLGLGLINAINLTEFKALLAHEFGHFSQKSAKTGGYVYRALRTVEKMVHGQDFFDRFIDGWCSIDIRISWPGWIFYGILWVLRKILVGMHYCILFFQRGLSRQMEFNADLVAVSVTGSDAPVHLLYRSSFADRCMGQTLNDLQTAMDHHLYTADLFFHHSHAVDYLRKREKKPTLGEPTPLPASRKKTTQLFEPDDDDQAAMWQTHPSNYDREQNAKAYYIRSEFDERSPWLLFDDVTDLRERVTYKFYRFHFKVPKDVELVDPEEVHAFLEDERAEVTYAPRYQGLYDSRNLVLGDIFDLAKEAKRLAFDLDRLVDAHAHLYTVEVKHRAQVYNNRIAEFNLLNAVARGWHKPKNDEIEFRGEVYDAKDAKRLFKKVEKEMAKDNEWLAEIDRKVFMTYFQMALHIGQETAEDLFRRYRFHLDLQKIWKNLRDQEAPVGAAIQFLQSLSSSELDTGTFQEALAIFRDAHIALRESLKAAEDLTIPPLKNIPAGQPLRPFLLDKKLVEGLSRYEMSISSKWIDKMLNQMRAVQKKVDRLHFKSLGGILALQEWIGQETMKTWEQLPTIEPLSPERGG